MQVDIGWKSFVIREANSQDGCLDGWEGVNDIGTPFGDGVYEKTTVRVDEDWLSIYIETFLQVSIFNPLSVGSHLLVEVLIKSLDRHLKK